MAQTHLVAAQPLHVPSFCKPAAKADSAIVICFYWKFSTDIYQVPRNFKFLPKVSYTSAAHATARRRTLTGQKIFLLFLLSKGFYSKKIANYFVALVCALFEELLV